MLPDFPAQYKRKLKKGVRWYYKFSFNGRVYFSRCIYLTKGEARQAEIELYSELEDRIRNPPRAINIMLYDLINERLDYLIANKSNQHYKQSRHYLKKFYKHFGNVSILEITKAEINKLLIAEATQQKKLGNDNYAVNAMIRVIKALFYYAIDTYELNMRNPCKGIKFYPIEKKMKYIPTDDELEKLLCFCDDEQIMLIEFVINTGARIGEALRLCGKDINEDTVVLYTHKSKGGNLIPRKVPKPDYLNGKQYKDDELIFGRWKEKPCFLRRKLHDLNNSIWSWHCLRHRYASILSKEGLPLFEIMKILGHSNLETTQIYLQLL